MTPAAWGIAAAVLAVVVALDRLANRVTTPQLRPVERTVPELGLPHEDLLIPSGDHELAAWYLSSGEAHPYEPLLLMAHGWGANYSTVLRLAEPLARHGHDVLLFDVRGHGRSEPAPFVTVRHFRDDILAVTRYAARRFPDRQLVLIGHSFGGAAGILAAADGAPVDGLVLVAAPADVVRVSAEFLTDQGLPGGLLMAVLRPFLWRRVGGLLGPLSPLRRIGELDVPLLLIQPEHDARVVHTHAEQLSRASGAPIRLIEGREHTDVLEAPETLRLVESFLEEL